MTSYFKHNDPLMPKSPIRWYKDRGLDLVEAVEHHVQSLYVKDLKKLLINYEVHYLITHASDDEIEEFLRRKMIHDHNGLYDD